MTGDVLKRSVLVVDDQKDFAEGVAEVLEINGYNAKVTFDQNSARELLKQHDFQVALIDLRLGNTSGLDLIGSLKAVRPGILCLIMTAYAEVDTAIEAVRRGAYDYLRKPLNTAELMANLDRCYEKIQLKEEKTSAENALRLKNRDLEELNSRLRDVVSSTKGLASCAYLDGFGELLLKEFSSNMSADGGSIYTFEDDCLILICSLDPENTATDIPFPLKKGSILEVALKDKQPILIRDLSEQEDLESSGWMGYKDGSVLVFPMVDDNNDVLGIVSLHNRTQPPFTQQDKELGTLLASYSCETLRALKAVEKLKERELAYATLFNNLLDIFFRTDREGNIIEVSPSFERIIGYPAERAVNLNLWRDLFADPEQGRQFIRQTQDNETVELYEALFRHKDGSDVWLSINARHSMDRDGNVFGVEGIARDISEMVSNRDELTRLATAIDQAAELIFITDTKGNFQYVNPSFERVTGYTKEEALGENVRLLKSGKQNEAFYRELWHTISRGNVWHGKLINKRKDGTLFQEEASITPIRDGSGRIIDYVAVKRDITKLAMLEGQLRQAQKMEAIGTLAGGIAHDFNNILSSIMGYSELAALDSPPDAKWIQHLNKVLLAAHRAKDLVDQILNFTRRKEHELLPMDLKIIIYDTLKLMRASLPATIDIQRWITPEERTVLADQTQIHQVVMNICANARHAMREKGGTLEVRLEGADVDQEFTLEYPDLKPEDYLMLTIRDTGHGMNRDMLERIFDPYYTTKEKGEGTGLGLAIVHTIVQNHKGHIRVLSEFGKGTTFYIYLPRAPRDTKFESAVANADRIPGGCERILVVDDEEDIVLILTSMLTRLGYKVVSFNKSKDALTQFKATPGSFDAVITDMTMPEMTGMMLATHIKEIRSEIPVLLCTGFSEFLPKDALSDIEVDGLLKKPIAMREMATTLRKVLDQASPTSNELSTTPFGPGNSNGKGS